MFVLGILIIPRNIFVWWVFAKTKSFLVWGIFEKLPKAFLFGNIFSKLSKKFPRFIFLDHLFFLGRSRKNASYTLHTLCMLYTLYTLYTLYMLYVHAIYAIYAMHVISGGSRYRVVPPGKKYGKV